MTIKGSRSPACAPGGLYSWKRRIPAGPTAIPEIQSPAPPGALNPAVTGCQAWRAAFSPFFTTWRVKAARFLEIILANAGWRRRLAIQPPTAGMIEHPCRPPGRTLVPAKALQTNAAAVFIIVSMNATNPGCFPARRLVPYWR
ncbi:hypothetical protein NJI34_37045 [Pseudomonas sp. S 311-6]|nr:hypothetical protein [Pseudomonas sp. S 311-6]